MGRKQYDIDRWELGPKVAELWATGARGRAIANAIMPLVVEACQTLGEQPPNKQSLTVKVDRYMATDPADRRTKQAKVQQQAKEIAVKAATEIMAAQVDAAQTLARFVQRIDEEVARIAQVMEKDPETGIPVVPVFKDYYTALSSMSKEMRGWITLLVDIKDRLWQYEQYETAFAGILEAVKAECDPDTLQRIVARLQANPAVMEAMRRMGGGG